MDITKNYFNEEFKVKKIESVINRYAEGFLLINEDNDVDGEAPPVLTCRYVSICKVETTSSIFSNVFAVCIRHECKIATNEIVNQYKKEAMTLEQVEELLQDVKKDEINSKNTPFVYRLFTTEDETRQYAYENYPPIEQIQITTN